MCKRQKRGGAGQMNSRAATMSARVQFTADNNLTYWSSCGLTWFARISMACFRTGVALDRKQDRAQGATKFELLSLAFRVLRKQFQLVQRLLKVCGCFG